MRQDNVHPTGLVFTLLGVSAAALASNRMLRDQLLEILVCQGSRRQASWYEESFAFFHYRGKDKLEAGVVIEREAQAVVIPAGLRQLK